jgi:predicted house-cleaning noncanonical NTP pyrophosphatase (MazG superfamily)
MKLVRDYIPEIIEESGEWCLTRTVHDVDEHMTMLKEKIYEEAQEFIENPSYEEAADMLEVVKAFCYLSGLEFEALEGVAQNKQNIRGGFYRGVILQKVGKESQKM